MRKTIQGLAVAVTMLSAGTANAAYYTFTFEGEGTGHYAESNRFDPDTPYMSGKAWASISVTIDDQYPGAWLDDGIGPYGFGFTDQSLSTWAGTSTSGFSRNVGALANFLPGTFSGLPDSIDMTRFTGGTMAFDEMSRIYSSSFSGNISLVTVSVQDTGSAGFGYSMTFVPEPSTWAMMLLGLGAVGWSMRQRGRKAVAIA